MKRTAIAAVAALLVVGLAGCGGPGSTASQAVGALPPTPSAPAHATSASAVSAASAVPSKATLASALLTVQDFPTGWTTVPAENDDSTTKGSSESEGKGACNGQLDANDDKYADAVNKVRAEFAPPRTSFRNSIRESIGAYASADELAAHVAGIAVIVRECGELVTEADGRKVSWTVGETSFPKLGEQTVGWTARTEIEGLTIFLNHVLVRRGGLLLQFDGSGVGSNDTYQLVQAMKKAFATVGRVIPANDANTTTTPSAAGPGTDAREETPTPVAAGPKPRCTYLGTDPDYKYMHVEVAFTNPLGEANDAEVTYALLDGKDGTRFFTGTAGGLDLADINFPRVNERIRMDVDTREKKPANIKAATIDCAVLEIKEGLDIGGYERASDADTCKVLSADSRGVKVQVSATSPYEETTDVQVWWALQAGDVRFDTETEVTDLVRAGETYKISESSGREIPKWVGDTPVTCSVVGFWDHP